MNAAVLSLWGRRLGVFDWRFRRIGFGSDRRLGGFSPVWLCGEYEVKRPEPGRPSGFALQFGVWLPKSDILAGMGPCESSGIGEFASERISARQA